ncbi:MAG: hypothetical protein QM791_00425 [Ferruginibacter sp.]
MEKQKRNVVITAVSAALVGVLFFAVMKLHADRARANAQKILEEFKTKEADLQRSHDSMMRSDTLIKFQVK